MKIIKLFQKAGKKRSVLSEIAEKKNKEKTMKVENEKKKGEWDTHFLTRSGSKEWQGQKPDGDGREKREGNQVEPMVSLSHLVHWLCFLISTRIEYSLRQGSSFCFVYLFVYGLRA